MSIDDMVGRDPRITMLAHALGWSRREAVGCLVADVWPIVYDQRTELISERVLDASAGHVGFAAVLIECELATRDRSGKVVIRGARERIKYLDHKTEAGRQGGLKSAETRQKNSSKRQASGEADVKHGGSTRQAAGNPPSPVPDSAPDPVPAHTPAPPAAPAESASGDLFGALKAKVDAATGDVGKQRAKKPAAEPKQPAPHQPAIDHFDARYSDAYGCRPEWRAAGEAKQIADLTKRHGADEVIRRIDTLFDGSAGLSWLKPPFTVGTLHTNWNRLVTVSDAPRVTDRRINDL
jgi:hypothetical protein